MSAPEENVWQDDGRRILSLNENNFQENSSYHPKRSKNKLEKNYLRENNSLIFAMKVIFSFIHMWPMW